MPHGADSTQKHAVDLTGDGRHRERREIHQPHIHRGEQCGNGDEQAGGQRHIAQQLAPFEMRGAVLVLIQAMQNINNPELLGSGIATAFVATIYGVGFANLIFIPIANKLKAVVIQRCLYQELIVEGVVSIANGENPRVIERKLAAYRVS